MQDHHIIQPRIYRFFSSEQQKKNKYIFARVQETKCSFLVKGKNILQQWQWQYIFYTLSTFCTFILLTEKSPIYIQI